MTFALDERAHLALTVHRGARGELAALLERHDCADEGTERLEWTTTMFLLFLGRGGEAARSRRWFAAGKSPDGIAVDDAGSRSGGSRSRRGGG